MTQSGELSLSKDLFGPAYYKKKLICINGTIRLSFADDKPSTMPAVVLAINILTNSDMSCLFVQQNKTLATMNPTKPASDRGGEETPYKCKSSTVTLWKAIFEYKKSKTVTLHRLGIPMSQLGGSKASSYYCCCGVTCT